MDALVQMLRAGRLQRAQAQGLVLPLREGAEGRGETGRRRASNSSTAEDVSQWLITEKLISTVPWDDAGAYLRFSVTFVAKDEADEHRILGEIAARLGDVKFEF